MIGDEVDWGEITVLFAGAGVELGRRLVLPGHRAARRAARQPDRAARLRELEQRLDDDRLVLNEGQFFDKWGRRMKIEEATVQ